MYCNCKNLDIIIIDIDVIDVIFNVEGSNDINERVKYDVIWLIINVKYFILTTYQN